LYINSSLVDVEQGAHELGFEAVAAGPPLAGLARHAAVGHVLVMQINELRPSSRTRRATTTAGCGRAGRTLLTIGWRTIGWRMRREGNGP
jgi:hypothetical protein